MPYKPLTSPRFSGNNRLKAAANNAPPLRRGASGEAVRILQKALIDQKIPLPISTKKHGTPDGSFGKETKAAVIELQKRHGLTHDGAVGMNTMQKLNDLFPEWAPAPPPVVPTSYEVPGVKFLLKQPNNQTCWAAVYTMIRSWRDRKNYDFESALNLVAPGEVPSYTYLFNRQRGLDLFALKTFYRKGGLKFGELESLTVEGWIEMLMDHGMLMIGTSFSSGDNGSHANLVWGVFGDGTVDGTQIAYIDPIDGFNHYEAFESFHKRLLGIVIIEDGLSDDVMDAFVQIAYF